MKFLSNSLIKIFFVIAGLVISSCSNEDELESPVDDPTTRVGYEILQVVSNNEIIVWINTEISQEEFDAIQLPLKWFKNQPREGDPDKGSFSRSPDASENGEFTDEELFGHVWRHNATVIKTNVPLSDGEGLLVGNLIAKFHEITFNAGRTLNILISPDGEKYVRVSRDAGRITDEPTVPSSWQLIQHDIQEELIIELPNPTLNIRTDNEDSFQGPVTF